MIMASTVFFILALAALAATRTSNTSFKTGKADGEIDLHGPLILDDMRFVEGQLEQAKTAGIPKEQLRWTSKMVPYTIDPSVVSYSFLIQQAMQEYHSKTCIRFVPRTIQRNYIRIFAGEGCYSHVGMIGGEQTLSLARGCMVKGTIVHELGHAIGFFHEQNRSDRDQYITIYWDNIQQDQESQFGLLKPNENILSTKYDYESIMHYGNHAFSKDGTSLTMVAKSGVRLIETYDKLGLTAEDVSGIKSMYDC